MKRVVVALGGNALITDAGHASIRDQAAAVASFAPQLVDLAAAGWSLVVTHGNGPQVGFIMRRSELSSHEVAPVPLDYAVADTQGAIGHMFLLALRNELRRQALAVPVVALVTQALVDAQDAAFRRPAKPVGAFFDEDTARAHAASFGWAVAQDSGRGWRRLVPSPEPRAIIELETVRALCDGGAIVVACGGGGVAVVEEAGQLRGVEAVIDKDLASALLADGLGAEVLCIPTTVDRAAVGFGGPDPRWLDELGADEAAHLVASGAFGEGSMRPKIEAMVRFTRGAPGRRAVLCRVDALGAALDGRAGTTVRSDTRSAAAELGGTRAR